MNYVTRGYIHRYSIVATLHEKAHGVAIYLKKEITDYYSIEYSMDINNIQIISIKIADLTIINVYKPPAAKWSSTNLCCAPYSAIYVEDFKSHSQEWGYEENNGEFLCNWISNYNMALIHNAKDPSTPLDGVKIIILIYV